MSSNTASKVGDRLSEPPAPEVIEYLYKPRAADNFDNQFIYMTEANKAHVVMLGNQGIISMDTAVALLKALNTLEERGSSNFEFDPEREDFYFNYEHAVTELTSTEIGGQMHTARSRNDLGVSMVRLRTRDVLLGVVNEALNLRSTLLDLAEEHADTIFPGYTHLQPAQPITFGHYLTAIETALERDTDRLLRALDRADASSLGAAAMAGTGYPIDREAPAEMLGFSRVAVNTLDAVANRDYMLEAMSAATILSLTINRFVQDLYVWYTFEFGLIGFRDRVSGTSSIMPQKKNPILLENIKGRTAHQAGALSSAIAGIRNSHFGNIVDANRIGFEPSWPALEELRICLILTRVAVENLIVNEQAALDKCQRDFSTVTQLADALVQEHSISFRQAHEIVGGVVRVAISEGGDASSITSSSVANVARQLFNLDLAISDESLRNALDPRTGVNLRSHLGGPAPTSVRSMIAEGKQHLADDHAEIEAINNRIAASKSLLERKVNDLLAANATPSTH